MDAIENHRHQGEQGGAPARIGLCGRGAMMAAKHSAICLGQQEIIVNCLEVDASECPQIDLGKNSEDVKGGEAKSARNKLEV